MGYSYDFDFGISSITKKTETPFDKAMGNINHSHLNTTSPTDLYKNKKNTGHNINPAIRTYMQNDIMRNGLTKNNEVVARVIDGNSGIFNTMVNQGMGDVRDEQIEYVEDR